jgi:hypothetical protein
MHISQVAVTEVFHYNIHVVGITLVIPNILLTLICQIFRNWKVSTKYRNLVNRQFVETNFLKSSAIAGDLFIVGHKWVDLQYILRELNPPPPNLIICYCNTTRQL